MAEVQGCKIEEVGNKNNLTRPEMASDPKHDVGKGQKIVLHALEMFSRATGR